MYEDAQRAIELELDLSGSMTDSSSSEEQEEEDFSVEDLACTKIPSSAPADLPRTRAASATASPASNPRACQAEFKPAGKLLIILDESREYTPI